MPPETSAPEIGPVARHRTRRSALPAQRRSERDPQDARRHRRIDPRPAQHQVQRCQSPHADRAAAARARPDRSNRATRSPARSEHRQDGRSLRALAPRRPDRRDTRLTPGDARSRSPPRSARRRGRRARHAHQALTKTAAPRLLAERGVGPETAARLLIVAGDNPDRLRSDSALAALCGASPVEASSGKTTRHRLNRGGDRQGNNALWTIQRPHDPRPRNPRLRCATLQGRQEQQGDPTLPHAPRRTRHLPTAHRRSARRPNPPSLDIGESTRWPRASSTPLRPS